jgi:hypothetical protein
LIGAVQVLEESYSAAESESEEEVEHLAGLTVRWGGLLAYLGARPW